METLIVKIKNQNKAAFTKELLKSFDFLEVTQQKKVSNKATISSKRKAALTQGFRELKKAEAGELKAKPAALLLKQLRNA